MNRNMALDFSDVLITPQGSSFSSRSEVELRESLFLFDRPMVPLIASNMDGVGTFEMARELDKYDIATAISKHYSVDALVEHFDVYNDSSIYSMGISKNDQIKFHEFYKKFPRIKVVCVDVANGYMGSFHDFLKEFKSTFPAIKLVAGNVVTWAGTSRLIQNGVHVVKVGIGSGSVCTTRIMTGVGMPQFSAVRDCSMGSREMGTIISDGGCQNPGDIAKAFVAGARYVMLGGMLAGHAEGGNDVDDDGNCIFYGMSSSAAMTKHNGGVADYRSSEGRVVKIPYRGPVKNTIEKILGGLRSTCTYTNSRHLSELHSCSYSVVNNQYNRNFESYTVGF